MIRRPPVTGAARLPLLFLAWAGLLLAFPGQLAAAPELPWPLVYTAQPTAGAAASTAPGRSWAFSLARPDGARLLRREPDGRTTPLVTGFVWAGEPAVSHDGRSVLFSGRRTTGERRGIWEVAAEGGEPRRVVDDLGDAGDPEYMTRNAINPPEFDARVRWITFTADGAGWWDARLGARTRHLYSRTLEPTGGRVVTWRQTFNPAGSDLFPTMLADGRVLYSTFSHYGPGPGDHGGRFYLAAMTWEGVGVNAIHGAQGAGPALRLMAAECPDRTVVFIESEGDTPDGSGTLAEFSWRRPLTTRRALSRDGARYRDPHPLPDGRLLVARAAPGESWALGLFDKVSGQFTPLIDDPQADETEGLAIAPRDEPMARIPAIWPDKYTTGDFHCMDVGESDRPELQDLPRGTVRSVRILQALPPVAGSKDLPPYDPAAPFVAGQGVRVRVLGEVPVFPDGSFHVKLPADVPLTFQTLDAQGVAVRTMRSWTWTRPWFMRTCVGCHADPELAPHNRVTDTLRSVLLPELKVAGATRPPGFRSEVMPILRRRCGGACHGPKVMPEMLRLDDWAEPPVNRAYRALVPRYVVPGQAAASPLIRLLRGEGGRPHPVALLPGELATLAAWIDLGAAWEVADE